MKRLGRWWVLLVMLVVVAAGVWFWNSGARSGKAPDERGTAGTQTGIGAEAVTQEPEKSGNASSGAAGKGGVGGSGANLPAWMQSGSAGASSNENPTPEPSATPEPVDAARLARMQAALQKLQQLQQQKSPSIPDVDAALADLERANGSSELQGLRLDVLRENLRVAARMQRLAEEYQALQQQKPEASQRVAHQAAVEQKARELEALQGELRLDFYRNAPTSPPALAKP